MDSTVLTLDSFRPAGRPTAREIISHRKKNLLTKKYPSWDFVDVSQLGYEGDCRGFETPVGQVLYEFKSYDHNVNRDQINKFIRDLDHTNINYGRDIPTITMN